MSRRKYYTKAERLTAHAKAQQRHSKTDKFRATREVWRQSPKGKQVCKAYQQSPRGKQARAIASKVYRQSPKGKQVCQRANKAYRNRLKADLIHRIALEQQQIRDE